MNYSKDFIKSNQFTLNSFKHLVNFNSCHPEVGPVSYLSKLKHREGELHAHSHTVRS